MSDRKYFQDRLVHRGRSKDPFSFLYPVTVDCWRILDPRFRIHSTPSSTRPDLRRESLGYPWLFPRPGGRQRAYTETPRRRRVTHEIRPQTRIFPGISRPLRSSRREQTFYSLDSEPLRVRTPYNRTIRDRPELYQTLDQPFSKDIDDKGVLPPRGDYDT